VLWPLPKAAFLYKNIFKNVNKKDIKLKKLQGLYVISGVMYDEYNWCIWIWKKTVIIHSNPIWGNMHMGKFKVDIYMLWGKNITWLYTGFPEPQIQLCTFYFLSLDIPHN
jgi:hypothetical protein